jgi:hypothetical protein
MRGARRVRRAGQSARHRQLSPAAMLMIGGVAELAGWLVLRVVGLVLMTILLLGAGLLSALGIGTTHGPRASGGKRRVLRRCYYCHQRGGTLYPTRLSPSHAVNLCGRCKRTLGGGKRRPR